MLDDRYWDNRYVEKHTPWDMGGPSPALTGYLKNQDRNSRILIPGAGRAWEAEWLIKEGFQSVSVLDYSMNAIEEAKSRFPKTNQVQWIQGDFFEHHQEYDLIVEQTFFCALDPGLRIAYAQHMKKLLKKGGILFGVLFNFPLSEAGPPFGGSKKEYLELFGKHFEIAKLEPCYNSIKPRAGREFFIELIA